MEGEIICSSNINLLNSSGHNMYQQIIIQKLYTLPTMYICFLFISEQTATWAFYSINWLDFVTDSTFITLWSLYVPQI